MEGQFKSIADPEGKMQFKLEDFQQIERIHKPTLDEMTSKMVRQFFTWWDSFSPNLPKLRDFDISDHWLLAPYIYVIDVLDEGKFFYRLNGEMVVEIVGHNQKGKVFELNAEDPQEKAFANYLQNIVETKKPTYCQGTLALFGRGFMNFESIDCPLSDEDGHVIRTLGVICPQDR